MGSGGSTASAARQEELNSGQVKLQDWTEQEVVGMLKIFAQIDHDRSDMIERGELEAFMKTQGRHMENFKSLDWNDDGKMDKREFFQWYTQSTHEEATAIFKRYAALFEWEYASGEHKPLAEQSEEDIRRILVLFSLFDKDKTSDKAGEIDATELSNLAAVLGGSDLKEICREEHVTAEVAEVDSMRLKELKQLIKNHGAGSRRPGAARAASHAAPRVAPADDWTKEEKDGVYNLFNQFDKDKSGTIDGEELGNLISALGLKAVAVADIDTGVSNGIRDGVIDHDEFLKVFGAAFFSSDFLGAPLFLALPRSPRAGAPRAGGAAFFGSFEIMTGRYQIRVGIQHGCYGASQGTGLPLGEVTIADALSRLDYETWMFGKWHLGFDEAAFLPTSSGDYHYGHYDACVNAWNHTVGKRARRSRAVRVEPDKPTKLLEAPEAYTAKFEHAGLNATRRTFLGMVALVDAAVGNVTDAWAAAGLGGVVVVASDNGSPHDARGFAGNLPLRGQKHELWEGGVRVPAFVFGAGVRGAPRGASSRAVDWWPTLVKLAGGASSADASLDGVDLWPAVARGDDVRSELLHNFDTSSKPTARLPRRCASAT
ncbi:arylsulfatase [Aureococcus anophagefferens]|nr:arylsulfatase [Aureococcus anophagefferens]